MAFNVKTKRTVNFDDKEFTPEIDTETRMRLGEVKFDTEANLQEAYEVIAGCFPKNKKEILSYLPKITLFEVQELRAYLLGGEKAVQVIDDELARSIRVADDELKKIVRENAQ